MPSRTDSVSGEHVIRLLQDLIRFNTTNPPGNEALCISHINGLLTAAGFSTVTLARDPNRPNLVTRLRGRGKVPPLLLYGHVDVVTTGGQRWQHPPFEGSVVDGYVWGRGALDMKGGIAMMLSALFRLQAAGPTPPGDVVLAILSDEEAGGDYGAKFLVEEHADLFKGIRYAIGELGGVSFYVGRQTFYPIQVAEKSICWLRARVIGPGGHGSVPMHGGSMAKLGRMLHALDRRRLPAHVTSITREMIEAIARALPFAMRGALRQLLNPALTDRVLDLLGPRGKIFDPALHNTVNATIVRGGEKINVVPSEIVVELDGRLLPGFVPDDLLTELRQIVGDLAEFEVVRHDAGPGEPDMGLFDTLADVLRDADPAAVCVPLLLSGVTDGRHFARLGIQSYGFLPMKLPQGFDVMSLAHAADERIPVQALEFGTEAIFRLLQRFGTSSEPLAEKPA